MRRTRDSVRIEWRGEQYTPKQLTAKTGIPLTTIYTRVRFNKPIDDAFIEQAIAKKAP